MSTAGVHNTRPAEYPDAARHILRKFAGILESDNLDYTASSVLASDSLDPGPSVARHLRLHYIYGPRLTGVVHPGLQQAPGTAV